MNHVVDGLRLSEAANCSSRFERAAIANSFAAIRSLACRKAYFGMAASRPFAQPFVPQAFAPLCARCPHRGQRCYPLAIRPLRSTSIQ